MDRRGFLGSILAACAAPAIVRADSLMRIVPRETVILPPPEVTPYFIEVIGNNGSVVRFFPSPRGDIFIPPGNWTIRTPLVIPEGVTMRSQ